MSNLKKNVFALIFITSFVLFLGSSLFIQAAEEERPLEIEYPEIGEWRPETVEQAVLPEYIKYIFNFAVAIAGLVAFGALVYGGFRYITSVGAPIVQTEAKDQIFAGIIGLVILLSSYLILTTVNPQLVILTLEKPEWPELPTDLPGVYLTYLIDGEDVVKSYTQNASSLDMPSDRMTDVKIVNPIDYDYETEEKKPGKYYYGAILFPQTVYIGEPPEICRSIIPGEVVEEWTCRISKKAASLVVFREVEKTDGEVTLCTGTEGTGDYCHTWGFTRDGATDNEWKGLEKLSKKVWSIKIEGNYLLILKGVVEGAWYTRDTVYLARFQGPGEWPDLTKYTINQCGHRSWNFWHYYQDSCATEYMIIPTY
ncbi:MAG: pilin [Candidatus Nealsonbacteria bacterium]